MNTTYQLGAMITRGASLAQHNSKLAGGCGAGGGHARLESCSTAASSVTGGPGSGGRGGGGGGGGSSTINVMSPPPITRPPKQRSRNHLTTTTAAAAAAVAAAQQSRTQVKPTKSSKSAISKGVGTSTTGTAGGAKRKRTNQNALVFGVDNLKGGGGSDGSSNARHEDSKEQNKLLNGDSSLVPNGGGGGVCVLGKSPSGNAYIVTPGRHKIYLTDLLAEHDKANAGDHPYVRALSHYAEDMYQEWRRREDALVPDVFTMTFRQGLPIEEARRMAVQCVVEFGVERELTLTTIHSAILNLFRLIYSLSVQTPPQVVTYAVFVSILVASIRHAVKMEERWELLHQFRGTTTSSADIIWSHLDRRFSALSDEHWAHYEQVNKSNSKSVWVESQCMQILDYPQTPPVAPDFLARFINVGGWQEYAEDYRDLANYLLTMALFAYGDNCPLRGINGSRLAAAALALAVKIINTDGGKVQYEFWPKKMELYSGYSLSDLRIAVHGLSQLLRNKPSNARILETLFPKWGTVEWK